jgi:putative sigma-54 modulation protein
MKVNVVGKELKVTEAINDYIERKLERIDKYFEDASAEVTVKTEKNEQIAEVMVNANGDKYRAEAEEKDLYASIDKVIDILEGQIRKTKTKREKMQKDNSLKQITISGEEEFAIEDEVIKTLHYEIKPMTMDDAKIKLREKPNNLFFTFINSDTNSVNVLYKLPDGKNFGVVEPES